MKTGKLAIWICMFYWTSVMNATEFMNTEGDLTTNKIEVGDFNEIRVNGLMEIHYEQTDGSPMLEVTLNQELHSKLKIEEKNRILTIELKGVKEEQITTFIVKVRSKWLKGVRVSGNANLIVSNTLSGDELDIRANTNSLVQLKAPVIVGNLSLKISGSANIVAENLETELLECNLEGSGSITIKGSAGEGKYSLAGSSDLHAYGMQVEELDCRMTGNGLAEVYAAKNLNASIVGKGEIRHKGDASVQQKIYGKGQINHIQ